MRKPTPLSRLVQSAQVFEEVVSLGEEEYELS